MAPYSDNIYNAIDVLYHADICAGGSGLGLALKLVFGESRLRTVVGVERSAYAAATLVARMEDQTMDPFPLWDLVETFDGKPWRKRVDILTAGFPCQPFSLAGKREGTRDERWIWNDIVRIIREMGPPLVFLENVPGLTLSELGDEDRIPKGWFLPAGLWHVLGDLAALNFDAEVVCVRAEDTGTPHERARVFILGYSRDFASLQKYGNPRSRTAKGSDVETHGGSGEPGDELEHADHHGPIRQQGDGREAQRGFEQHAGFDMGDAARDYERRDSLPGSHGPRQPAGGPVSNVGDSSSSRRQQESRSSSGDETEDAGRSAISGDELAGSNPRLDDAASRRRSDQSESQGLVHERAQFERADSELAESTSGGQSELWEPSGSGGQSDRDGDQLADATDVRTETQALV